MFGDQTCHNFFGGHVRKILLFHSVLLECEKRGEVFRERGVNRNDTVIYSFLYATSWQTALILLLSNILITIIANEKSHWKPNFVLIVRLAEEWYVQFSGRVSRITKPKRSNIGCEESKLLKTAFFSFPKTWPSKYLNLLETQVIQLLIFHLLSSMKTLEIYKKNM